VEDGSPRAEISSKSKSQSRIHVHDAGHLRHAAKSTSVPCAKKEDNNTATLRATRSESRTPATDLSQKREQKGRSRLILWVCKDREEEGLEVERQTVATAIATAPHHEHVWTYLCVMFQRSC
jgi:hypothetical protein